MNIRILGAHSQESISTGCICFIVDDVLAIDAGSLTSKLSVLEQKKLEAVLLTHQHYDHVRDIPGIALNNARLGLSIKVYSTDRVRSAIENHLLNGFIYPKFQELPDTRPAIEFQTIEPYKPRSINGHEILALPVQHGEMTVGYHISNGNGNTMFYTADTGPGLAKCWRHISPQALFVDVSLPNSYERFARETGHLTPNLLREELAIFKQNKGYLPRIIAVHMDPHLEQEINGEITDLIPLLDTDITVAQEGMVFDI